MIKDRITAALCYYSNPVNANATSWSLHNRFIQSQIILPVSAVQKLQEPPLL